jgi:hypothetical protein
VNGNAATAVCSSSPKTAAKAVILRCGAFEDRIIRDTDEKE